MGSGASLTPSWREPVERSEQDKAPTVSPSAVRGPSSFLFPVELGRRPGGSEMLLGIFGSKTWSISTLAFLGSRGGPNFMDKAGVPLSSPSRSSVRQLPGR